MRIIFDEFRMKYEWNQAWQAHSEFWIGWTKSIPQKDHITDEIEYLSGNLIRIINFCKWQTFLDHNVIMFFWLDSMQTIYGNFYK